MLHAVRFDALGIELENDRLHAARREFLGRTSEGKKGQVQLFGRQVIADIAGRRQIQVGEDGLEVAIPARRVEGFRTLAEQDVAVEAAGRLVLARSEKSSGGYTRTHSRCWRRSQMVFLESGKAPDPEPSRRVGIERLVEIENKRSEERRVGKECRDGRVTGVQTCALPIWTLAEQDVAVEAAGRLVLARSEKSSGGYTRTHSRCWRRSQMVFLESGKAPDPEPSRRVGIERLVEIENK